MIIDLFKNFIKFKSFILKLIEGDILLILSIGITNEDSKYYSNIN